jgi:hypothetical protein
MILHSMMDMSSIKTSDSCTESFHIGGFSATLKLHHCLTLTKQMTATLNLPKTDAMVMLAKAQTGEQLLQILDAVVDTQEDQVPVVDVADEISAEYPDDAYLMENDYDDSMDV